MSTPLAFPAARIVEHVDTRRARTLRRLLADAGVKCRATGAFTERLVRVLAVPADRVGIDKEPGDWTPVRVRVPRGLSKRAAARWAVAALAYGLMDLVARESVRGEPWARPAPPRGRPRRGTAKSNRERQRAYRMRHRR